MSSTQKLELAASIAVFVVCAIGLVRHWPVGVTAVLFALLAVLLIAPWAQMRRSRRRI